MSMEDKHLTYALPPSWKPDIVLYPIGATQDPTSVVAVGELKRDRSGAQAFAEEHKGQLVNYLRALVRQQPFRTKAPSGENKRAFSIGIYVLDTGELPVLLG
jgi:hypothetical protein